MKQYLYHYYEWEFGPFCQPLTERSFEDAKQILFAQKAVGRPMNPDFEGFLKKRYDRDRRLREAFIVCGGHPQRATPYYMMFGRPDRQWASAYDQPGMIKIPLKEFDPLTVSFTYGDSFAVFNPALWGPEEYWGKIYFADEILGVIARNGFPPKVKYDFKRGIYPKDKPINHHLKYVEAHIWSDEIVGEYREAWNAGRR